MSNLGDSVSMNAPEDKPRTQTILIVEDEELFAKAMKKRLERMGYQCVYADNLRQASEQYRSSYADLILLDMRLPDGSGLDFLSSLRADGAKTPVLVLSAYGELEDVVAAMKLNAVDYLKKPIDLDELALHVEGVLNKSNLSRQLEYSRTREQHAKESVALQGDHPSIVRIREQARLIGTLSTHNAEEPPIVLIVGETGTGKDLAARALHANSARSDRPFVHVDCATLPKDLIEAELFGHEKGAFTDAHSGRTGLIEAAEDGVVFLDEIGELPLWLQAKLLSVLERRKLRRVGSTREKEVRAWFICATNRDLQALVDQGQFRTDLYFRLNVLRIAMPALRERGSDVLLLAEYFARQTAQRYGLSGVSFGPEAKDEMLAYAWPGNVRELKHLVERAVLLSPGGVIECGALMLHDTAPGTPDAVVDLDRLTLDEAEHHLITRALQRTGNNVSEAARQLGVTRMAMRYRIKKHGLDK